MTKLDDFIAAFIGVVSVGAGVAMVLDGAALVGYTVYRVVQG